MKTLYLIPARGGSKGIPNKNRKKLAGKELLLYTLEAARKLANDEDICLSTDDEKIISIGKKTGLAIPFVRPQKISGDRSSSAEVIVHALQFYANKNKHYERVVLLQPTSPFRTAAHIREALKLYNSDLDMVVSVKETRSNPYTVLKEEDAKGYLHPSKKRASAFTRRQDAPKVFELNGAIYIINVESFLKTKNLAELKKVKKYLMTAAESLDIDEPLDWEIAELMLKKRKKKK